jgi:hypothetical protein
MDKKKVLLIAGGVIVLGAVAYFMFKKKGNGNGNGAKVLPPEGGMPPEEFEVVEEAPTEPEWKTTPIATRLKWIQSKDLARYMSDKLNPEGQATLKGWVDLIRKERQESEGKKWACKPEDKFSGEFCDIAHAMYQMGKSDLWTLGTKQDFEMIHAGQYTN